jgi:hemin uptake protein HemP
VFSEVSDETSERERENCADRIVRVARKDERGCPVYRFDDLVGDARIVLIEQDEAVYELRKTRNGKLILSR